MTALPSENAGGSYSVLVRTRNSEKTLARTLQSLRIQSVAPREVVVVDSGSVDGTVALAERFGARVVLYPAGVAFNYSKALNVGMEAARFDNVLIISSHTVVPFRETLRFMLDSVSRESVAGAYCATVALADDRTRRIRRGDVKPRAVEIGAGNFDGQNGLWNTCALIKKKFWTAHAFQENVWAAEDQEWAGWQFRNEGVKIIRVEASGALDLNTRRSKWKFARDHVAVAKYCYRDYYKWTTILRRFAKSGKALMRRDMPRFKEESLHGVLLALHRLGLMEFKSEYHSGPPRWLAWLAR